MEPFKRKYNTALTTGTYIEIPVIKVGTVGFATSSDWTPAVADVRLHKDDSGTWADIGSAPTFQSSGGTGSKGVWRFPLSASELSCKKLTVVISDPAIEDQCFMVETFGNPSAMYPSDPTVDSTFVESVLTASAKTMMQGTVNSTGNTTTQITLSTITTADGGNSVGANALAGRRVFFSTDTTTAGLRGCGARITANTATSGTTVLTLDSNDTLPATPATGDTLAIA